MWIGITHASDKGICKIATSKKIAPLNTKEFAQKFNVCLMPQFEKAAQALLCNKYQEKRKIWVEVAQDDRVEGKDVMCIVDEQFKNKFKDLFVQKYQEVFGTHPIPDDFENIKAADEKHRLEELSVCKSHEFYENASNGWFKKMGKKLAGLCS